jgi:hypothetical protein
MHRSLAFIEPLEDRRLFTVSAATLVGPLSKGTTWTYKVTAASSTYTATNKVVGTRKIGKINCVEVDTSTGVGATITSVQSFVNLSSAGLLVYKQIGTSSGSSFSATTTHVPSPFNTQFPPSLKAGKTYKFAWTDVISTVSTPGGTTARTASVSYTIKLMSDTLKKVKVPAGTFNCYSVVTKLTTVNNGVASVQNVTHYIAPNIGDVKFVSDGVTTTQLTKFVKGK